MQRAEGELQEAGELRAEAEGLNDAAFAADAAAMELRLQVSCLSYSCSRQIPIRVDLA